MSFIHSVKFTFTVWYLLVLTVLLGALSTGVYFYLSGSLYSSFDNLLSLRTKQLQNIRGVLESIDQGRFEERLGEVVVFYFQDHSELRSISSRELDISLDDRLVRQALDGKAIFTTVPTAGGERLRFLIVPFSERGPVSLPPGPGAPPPPTDATPPPLYVESAVLAVGRSTRDIKRALDGLTRTLAIAVPLTLVMAGAGGVFLAKRAMKPVDQITQIARQIEESDLSQRIVVTTRDELGRLTSTLNQMIGRLEEAFNRQQQFTGDASHELRTPLSVIQAESTLALQKSRSPEEYRQSLQTVTQEAEHMTRVIDQLLFLARADARIEEVAHEDIDLSALVTDMCSDAHALSGAKSVRFQLGPMEEITIRGDQALLGQLLRNLLDNALRYTPAGGLITVSTRRQEQMAVLSITDTGIGIPREHLPHVFERFYRVDKARSRLEGGSGLGLAICKHIVEVHGGRIEVKSQVGQGSTLSVFLPLHL